MTYQANIIAAIDERIAYERAKNAQCDSIVATLNAMRKKCEDVNVCDVLASASVDANFINLSERVNARFNVYSAEKIFNIALCAASRDKLNHYTKAIVLACRALKASEATDLTHADAQSACSLSVSIKDAKREKILRDAKFQKHVAASTANTQSSSSINALKAFKILSETRDAANVVRYTLNSDNATLAALAIN